MLGTFQFPLETATLEDLEGPMTFLATHKAYFVVFASSFGTFQTLSIAWVIQA